MKNKELVDSARAAEYLNLAPSTLATWRSRKMGPPYLKVGARRVVYSIDALNNWLGKNPRQGQGEPSEHQSNGFVLVFIGGQRALIHAAHKAFSMEGVYYLPEGSDPTTIDWRINGQYVFLHYSDREPSKSEVDELGSVLSKYGAIGAQAIGWGGFIQLDFREGVSNRDNLSDAVPRRVQR